MQACARSVQGNYSSFRISPTNMHHKKLFLGVFPSNFQVLGLRTSWKLLYATHLKEMFWTIWSPLHDITNTVSYMRLSKITLMQKWIIHNPLLFHVEMIFDVAYDIIVCNENYWNARPHPLWYMSRYTELGLRYWETHCLFVFKRRWIPCR